MQSVLIIFEYARKHESATPHIRSVFPWPHAVKWVLSIFFFSFQISRVLAWVLALRILSSSGDRARRVGDHAVEKAVEKFRLRLCACRVFQPRVVDLIRPSDLWIRIRFQSIYFSSTKLSSLFLSSRRGLFLLFPIKSAWEQRVKSPLLSRPAWSVRHPAMSCFSRFQRDLSVWKENLGAPGVFLLFSSPSNLNREVSLWRSERGAV